MDNGDWLILDNCRIHTTKFAEKLTTRLKEDFGITYCLLPKYSPELNPPEKVFAKTKGILTRSRYDTLLEATISAMDKITMSDMISFYKFLINIKFTIVIYIN